MTDREKDLQAEELADLARRLERALEVDAPDARREKALFVAGAGTRARRSHWTAALVPATAAVVVLVVLAIVSRTALPGQTLYPVRKVLGGVGLAPSTAREVREHLDEAEELIAAAAASAVTEPSRAQELVREAIGTLEAAEELVDELDGERAEAFDRQIDALEERADAADDAADDELDARDEEAEAREDQRDDSSGRGSGGSGDDSSGPGPGGGEDSGGNDDSSGSGSGDDDSSGPGSRDDDSSGRGSGDDSSGPGSGDDD
ncbi:MAG TPA: hypothetical protein VHI71_08635 [Actinomycetota bacterium]|nr:hypothetical protein [Actinomycetota bacterium]